MSDEKEAPEKVKIEVYETDLATGTIRRNYIVELQSTKQDVLRLKEEALDTLRKIRPPREKKKDDANGEAYMW